MHLNSYEREKIILYMAGELAKKRLERGLKLNYPESVALITHYVMEGARDGKSVKELMDEAGNILHDDQVMDGVDELLKYVQIEATFPDGTKLVTIHHPIKKNIQKKSNLIPGEYDLLKEKVVLLTGRSRIKRIVYNTGNRPIQVGSHFHFYETNLALHFDRNGTQGYRLDIPSGRSVRFEPLETKEVLLVKIGGSKKVYGFSGKENIKI
ncbi:MAG: urease subunit gamma [Flavobacteriales bacterium]|jgi:urease subunit gamma/beta|uniref:urease subunit gamma n=1 Tax=Blattabacterium sp. (Mastotermes darwiniensis) TaxID=39768 RepID=UPI000231DDE7|nr:urease subunit gamma [Blattabacterium sp. (Mastotermes darwiniensis)]AER40539.1 bifunctional urease gamma/beta subunit [Blattabacterium sp. (Mastotermes darwiniensis) str. MADAR]MDR1804947.1 urease subunit gamma [Flavobacteriales bacterium]